MYTLLLLLALQAVNPREMACLGFIQETSAPADVYIAAVQDEGTSVFASEGQILHLNGPKAPSLNVGEIQRVIRPEGRVHDPWAGDYVGTYYRDLGTVRIEAVGPKNATARVLLSCQPMLKGDLVVPGTANAAVEFTGDLSNALTPIPDQGLISSIVLAKDDMQEIAAGHFCFIGLGARDGVKPGDRFTIFRAYPSYNSGDLSAGGEGANASYSPVRGSWYYRYILNAKLRNRTLPFNVLGDFVVARTGDRISAGKIVNSLSEIQLGDLVVKQ